jgi:hypothetical protein
MCACINALVHAYMCICVRVVHTIFFPPGTVSAFHAAYSKPEKWSLEDGRSKNPAIHTVPAYPQGTYGPAFIQDQVTYLQQTYASPALPLQQLPVSGNYYQVT